MNGRAVGTHVDGHWSECELCVAQLAADHKQERSVPIQRSEPQFLASVCQLLEELLAEVKHLRALVGQASDSHSSVELKVSSARTAPDPCVKVYAGSPTDGLVDTALAEFGRLKREADARSSALDGWRETLDALRGDHST